MVMKEDVTQCNSAAHGCVFISNVLWHMMNHILQTHRLIIHLSIHTHVCSRNVRKQYSQLIVNVQTFKM